MKIFKNIKKKSKSTKIPISIHNGSKESSDTAISSTHRNYHKFYTILAIFFIFSVLVLNIYISNKLSHANATIKDNTQLILDQERLISQIIDNATEIRKTLELPELMFEEQATMTDEITYDEIDTPDSTNTNEESNTEDLLLEDIQEIFQDYNIDKVSSNFTSFINKNNLPSFAENLGLTIEQKDTALIIRYQGSIVATINALYNLNSEIYGLHFNSTLLGSTQSFPVDASTTIIQQIHIQLMLNIEESQVLFKEINRIFLSSQIKNLFRENRAYFKFIQNKSAYIWKVYNFAQQELYYIELSKFKRILKTNYEVIEIKTKDKNISKLINETLLKLDYNSNEKKLALKNYSKILAYTEDLRFKNNLHALGLEIAPDSREDNDYIYLDILASNSGTKIGALGILKNDGSFWTIDKDDVPILQKSMYSIAPKNFNNTAAKKNYLLVGSHNKLADTIMIAHINEQNQIKLISIPRDLYYRGRKINWYFKHFSPKNFNALLSSITGIPITQYVYVDMYAFVSIIDILGGINVTLDAPLIDPSYRIKVNGRITYLNISEGEHFFNGLEALRVARSRHSTSDFDRASRQQAIIEGIQSKLTSVDKFSTFLSIVKIVDKIKPYISTNISNFEMAKLAQKYRNAVISERIVLNTSNILYSTYSRAFEEGIPVSEIDPEKLGQWILLPKNNDWNSLQNFIESFILK